MITIYTIWFTKKSANDFFWLLKNSKVKEVIDTRINTTSQLSWFAKSTDLPYFLEKITWSSYSHEISYAPTKELLKQYRSKELDWEEYESLYRTLIKDRNIELLRNIKDMDWSCLLCSEHQPHFCHRRLLAEYLSEVFPNSIHIEHLQ